MPRTLEQAEKAITDLIEENKRLASELEMLKTSGAVLEKTAQTSVTAKKEAEQSAATLKTQLETVQKQAVELRAANQTLSASVARLNSQVAKAPLNPLTVEEASQMFERVLSPFRASKTLEVRGVVLSLKLATGKLGDQAVLMVPDPVTANPQLLHEVRLELVARREAESSTVRPVFPVAPPVPVRPVGAARTRKAAKKAAAKVR